MVAELSEPTVRVHVSYLAAIVEYRGEGGYPDFDGLEVDEPAAFARYVEQLRRNPLSIEDRKVLPPMTLRWWIDGADYLGRISIWHALTGRIADSGHIGYDIVPSARERGHAKAMLRAALPVAHSLGIDPAVVVVGAFNMASRRVIEANGGRLVDQRQDRWCYEIPTSDGRL